MSALTGHFLLAAQRSASSSLSVNGFHSVGHKNPALSALQPNEVVRPNPTRVVESARLQHKDFLDVSRDLINADSTLRTEYARVLVATVGNAGKTLGRAGDRQAFFGDD